MAIYSNLYPPIINTYMPAFIAEDGVCKIYFSLSSYNAASDIKNVQITVRNQKTNASMLNNALYPSEVKLTTLNIDSSVATDAKYYIILNKTDMENNEFVIDQYYKIQIRFTNTSATEVSLDTPQQIDAWLSENLECFSEWSTVCLIRGISKSSISIQGLTEGTDFEWSLSNITLNGKLVFENENETETLRSYQIQVYDDSDELIEDSGLLYSESINPNEFNYKLNYIFQNNQKISIKVSYTTQNLYSSNTTYTGVVKYDTSLSFSVSAFTITPDIDNGILKINVQSYASFNDTIVILRKKINTNYIEEMYEGTISQNPLNFDWYDNTFESGILYQYGVQKRRISENKQSIIIWNDDYAGLVLDHMYLSTKDKQLKIAFIPTISSMKTNVSDSKIDTIGSPYPFITRNGATNYKTFPISGLISTELDENALFTSKDELGLGNDEYTDFNALNGIKVNSDYTYERKFRDAVNDYLLENNAKLFRSATEGNIIIRLTDVNLSPNTTLGRRLWIFSATAYEIADCTLENMEEYDIFDKNTMPRTYVDTNGWDGDSTDRDSDWIPGE